MPKASKTNAMRFLEAHAVDYRMRTYGCDEFIDGVAMARQAGIPVERTFKTLVTVGASHRHFVFAIPVAGELDLKKAARAACEKSIALLPTQELFSVTGYVRGGCTVVGMKRQFPTVLDRHALAFETIFLSGGRIGALIEVDPRAIAAIIDASFADLSLR